MTQESDKTALVPSGDGKLYKTNQELAKRRSMQREVESIPHIGVDQVRLICEQLGERDRLLVQLLFDACLRVSEALSIRPWDLENSNDGWYIRIHGKGSTYAAVAISSSLVAQLQAYAYRKQLKPEARLFDVTRGRVHQIIKQAMADAGVVKPDRVGAVHVLRHSGALERLRQTGNPKAVQDQLRHRSTYMTLRYMKTLSQEESLRIQQGVDFQW